MRNIEAMKLQIRVLNSQVAADRAKKTSDRMPPEEIDKAFRERRRLKKLLENARRRRRSK